jgi:nucleotide-binding universal stress UspA family protein
LLKDAFVGTTAERAIRSVFCPVLMVNGPPVGPWRHALLTSDLSDASAAALRRFDQLGIGGEAGRTLLHVFDAPALRLGMTGPMRTDDREDHLSEGRAAALREMSAFVATLGIARAEMVARHAESTAASAILRAASDMRSDLIVLAKQSKGAMERMLLGSVTEKVLGAAPVDVLVIQPEQG